MEIVESVLTIILTLITGGGSLGALAVRRKILETRRSHRSSIYRHRVKMRLLLDEYASRAARDIARMRAREINFTIDALGFVKVEAAYDTMVRSDEYARLKLGQRLMKDEARILMGYTESQFIKDFDRLRSEIRNIQSDLRKEERKYDVPE